MKINICKTKTTITTSVDKINNLHQRTKFETSRNFNYIDSVIAGNRRQYKEVNDKVDGVDRMYNSLTQSFRGKTKVVKLLYRTPECRLAKGRNE